MKTQTSKQHTDTTYAQTNWSTSFRLRPMPALHFGTRKVLFFSLFVFFVLTNLSAYSHAQTCFQFGVNCSEWRQFRSDASHTAFNPYETNITVSNAPNLKVKWSDASAAGNSTPTVAREYPDPGSPYDLFVGTSGNLVLGYNANGKRPSWNAPPGPNWTATSVPNSSFNSSPAIGSSWDPLYPDEIFTAGDSTVEARTLFGTLLWSGTYGGNNGSTIISSATLASVDFGNGVTLALFVGSTDGHVYAFDTKACAASANCNPVWKSQSWPDPKGHAMYASPAVANNMVYMGEATGDGGITAYNAATGKIVWGDHQDVGWVISSPTVVNGVVYFGATWYTGAGYIYAFNATSGTLKWKYPTSGGVESSPAYANGVIYVGSQGGVLYGIYAGGPSDGTLACSGTTNFGAPIGFSSPGVADGVVFVGGEDGILYAFDATTPTSCGSQLLALPLGLQYPIESSPAIANGMVYVETPEKLFAVAP